jgi:hypothetical protein
MRSTYGLRQRIYAGVRGWRGFSSGWAAPYTVCDAALSPHFLLFRQFFLKIAGIIIPNSSSKCNEDLIRRFEA